MVMVDPERRVELWNSVAQELWGLAEDEVRGRLVTDLDIGLPLEGLREELTQALDSGEPEATMLSGRDRRGFPLACRATCAPLRAVDDALLGAILLIEPWDEAQEA